MYVNIYGNIYSKENRVLEAWKVSIRYKGSDEFPCKIAWLRMIICCRRCRFPFYAHTRFSLVSTLLLYIPFIITLLALSVNTPLPTDKPF